MTDNKLEKYRLTDDLKEEVARWLFKNKTRLPNQRFYANWYYEISASPSTEKEYLNLAGELLAKLLPLLEEAKREERERILQQIDRYAYFQPLEVGNGKNRRIEMCRVISNTTWQALQPGKKGE